MRCNELGWQLKATVYVLTVSVESTIYVEFLPWNSLSECIEATATASNNNNRGAPLYYAPVGRGRWHFCMYSTRNTNIRGIRNSRGGIYALDRLILPTGASSYY